MRYFSKAMLVASAALCLNLSAYSQDISLKINNVTVKEAMERVKKDTGYSFVFSSKDVNTSKRISVSVSDASIEEVIKQILKGQQGLDYEIQGKKIVLRKAQPVSANGNQEKKTVSGKVVDANGEPVIGATIMEKGTTNGTITDFDGNFNLNVADGAQLEVSYVGFKTQNVKAVHGNIITVALKEDTEVLEEVVVVGYGVQKKSDVTGATLRVGSKELESRPVNNALEALQGKAAGVDISSTHRPGTLGSISIRGVRSLTASNSPLYVVDGVPLMTDGIDYLNTNDIESIDVLKDASATAIYGSRGANGVVIITTKTGKSGKANINYSGSMTVETLQDNYDMMDAAEYIEWRRWAYYYSNPNIYPDANNPTKENDYKIFNGAADQYSWANIEKGWESGTWDPSKVETTDWIGMIKQTGITQQHTLSASGGTDKMKGYFSFGYLDNEGTVKGQGYTRYTAKVSFDINPIEWFSLGGNITSSYSILEYGQSKEGSNLPTGALPSIYSSARNSVPFAVPYDDKGERIKYPGGDQTLATIVDEWDYSQDQRVVLRTFASFYTQIDFGKIVKPLKGLKYRLNFGPDISNYRQGIYLDSNSVARSGSSYASLKKRQKLSYTFDQLLYYDKKISKHSLGLTFLQSMTKYNDEESYISAENIPLASQKWNALTKGNISTLKDWSSSITDKQLLSYMVRMNYNFADKYLLTASGRWDGASQLADGNKWSFFPSLALGWRIDQEDFMINTKDVISQLKLRLGVGMTGNAAITPYTTKGGVNSIYYPSADQLLPGTYPSNVLANKQLGWEKTTQYNIGIDFSLYNGRLSGIIDIYKSSTKDLLMNMSIPSVTGYMSTYANIGETSNRGVDLSLSSVNIDNKDFRWTTDLNLSWNNNRIESLSNGKEDDLNNKWFIGKPIGVIYDYAYGGIWKEEDTEEMEKFNANGHKFQIGMVKPVDQNKDYKIDANNDRIIIGNTLPKWNLGMTNTFSYKGLELSVFLYGKMGYYYNTEGEAQTGRLGQRKINYYNENNKDSEYQKPIYSSSIGDPYFMIAGYKKASFVKVRNLSLGYVFPKNIISRIGVSNLKIYAQLANPGMLFSSIDFIDLDMSGSVWNRGYTMGLNVTF